MILQILLFLFPLCFHHSIWTTLNNLKWATSKPLHFTTNLHFILHFHHPSPAGCVHKKILINSRTFFKIFNHPWLFFLGNKLLFLSSTWNKQLDSSESSRQYHTDGGISAQNTCDMGWTLLLEGRVCLIRWSHCQTWRPRSIFSKSSSATRSTLGRIFSRQ